VTIVTRIIGKSPFGQNPIGIVIFTLRFDITSVVIDEIIDVLLLSVFGFRSSVVVGRWFGSNGSGIYNATRIIFNHLVVVVGRTMMDWLRYWNGATGSIHESFRDRVQT
jgi:hypothetical protein